MRYDRDAFAAARFVVVFTVVTTVAVCGFVVLALWLLPEWLAGALCVVTAMLAGAGLVYYAESR